MIQWPGQLLLYSPVRWLLRVTGWARRRILQSVQRAFHDSDKVPANLPTRHLRILRSKAAVRACRETVRNMVPSDIHEIVEAYGRLDTPTLVLWGRQDQILSPLYGQRFVDELPRARLHLFDDCGHAPHLEQPEQMARIIHDWLHDTMPDGDGRPQ
ncbi:MAG: alpha/beta fold hydrolase [Gemmatimonadetes bacterium]|nr:alpha/beta fold hydrolase [Gemmatimonadota bacterium]